MHATSSSTTRTLMRTCFASAVLGLAMAGAHAANAAKGAAPSDQSDIQARYLKERAVCMNGTSNQDRTTCLKEAGAARDQARRGQLNDGDAKYKRNARERCDALSGDEATDCRARMRGAGTTSGSVEAGGIFRETVTIETKPADLAASAPAR